MVNVTRIASRWNVRIPQPVEIALARPVGAAPHGARAIEAMHRLVVVGALPTLARRTW